MLPNFLIIGAQKSASTFLHLCLKEHPDVFMPFGEIPYFEDPDYHQTELTGFESLFNEGSTKKAIGIKRPNYLAKPECPERIKALLPEAKLIAVLRNPVERAVSAYFHYIHEGFIPSIPIEKGMIEILDGKYKTLFPRSREIIDFGFYYQKVKRYLAFFAQEQILILFYHNIVRNSLEQTQKMYRFLEIDDSYIPHQLHTRPMAAVYSLKRLKFLGLRNRFLYRYNHDNTRLYLKGQRSMDKVVCRVIGVLDHYVLSSISANEKPKLSEGLRQRLHSLYERDWRSLEELVAENYL